MTGVYLSARAASVAKAGEDVGVRLCIADAERMAHVTDGMTEAELLATLYQDCRRIRASIRRLDPDVHPGDIRYRLEVGL
jgi:hypothetical protein